ncbi:inner membrane protein YbjM [Musicola paradisiaca]|uniref:Uncharacterized protein n=1 Tax=Musicola paradisiaca (strain Ech703) TaxID=579405 RepID=C6C8B0_MUSP7|nr:inner membrane protein YbjM [Musicola paradisiaca]ACS86076.1 conserved hypothetical protein [Musicola paradisiaca Ech703]
MTNNRGWVGVVGCFVLFILVFLSQKMTLSRVAINDGFRGEPGMLLFLLPGLVSCYLSGCRRLKYTLLGALAASLICLLLLQVRWSEPVSFWQELAYLAGAVFWCLLGGLTFLFLRAVSRHYFH